MDFYTKAQEYPKIKWGGGWKECKSLRKEYYVAASSKLKQAFKEGDP